mgnify:FL=1
MASNNSSLSTYNGFRKFDDTLLLCNNASVMHHDSKSDGGFEFDRRINSEESLEPARNFNNDLNSVKSSKFISSLLQNDPNTDRSEVLYFRQTQTQRYNSPDPMASQKDKKCHQIVFVLDSKPEENRVNRSNVISHRQNGPIRERHNNYYNPFSGVSDLHDDTSETGRETFNGKLYRDTYNRNLSRSFLDWLEKNVELQYNRNSNREPVTNVGEYINSFDSHIEPVINGTDPTKNIDSLPKEFRNCKITLPKCEYEPAREEINHFTEHFERKKFFGAEMNKYKSPHTRRLSILTNENTLESNIISQSPPTRSNKHSLFSDPSSRFIVPSPTETSHTQIEESFIPTTTTTTQIIFKVPSTKLDTSFNKRYLQKDHPDAPVTDEKKSNSVLKTEERDQDSFGKCSFECDPLRNEIEETPPNDGSLSPSSFDELERARNSLTDYHFRQIYFQKAGELESDEDSYEIPSQDQQYGDVSDYEDNNALGRLYTIEDVIEETVSTHQSADFEEGKLNTTVQQQTVNLQEINFAILPRLLSNCATFGPINQLDPRLREKTSSLETSPSKNPKDKNNYHLNKRSPTTTKNSKKSYEGKENFNTNLKVLNERKGNSTPKENLSDSEIRDAEERHGPEHETQFWNFRDRRKVWFQSVYKQIRDFRGKKRSLSSWSMKPNGSHASKDPKSFKV